MSGEIATSKAAQPKIPDVLWQQSGRPIQGLLLQIWIVLMMVAVAWVVVDLTTNPVMWAIAVLGPLGFLLVPALTERLVLERYGK
ncbi:MAG: hypothetical protein KC457_13235, partial [Myxococcales bacterium]|nr:hypothetical protein [Myxococcales bacterium]